MTCNPTTPGDGRWTCETCGADLGTSEGKAAPDFARCPQPFRGPEFDEGDPAGDWLRSVDSLVGDDVPPPVPIDELADTIRANGGLDETPALALLDEIQRLRAARSDYDRGIADAVAVIEPMLTAATELLMAANHWTDSTDAIAGLEDTVDAFARARDAVAALKRGDA